MSEVSCMIKHHIAVLSSSMNGWKKEFNLISWNGGAVKADIREWSPDKMKMSKGVTLNRTELIELKKMISSMDISLVDENNQPAKQRKDSIHIEYAKPMPVRTEPAAPEKTETTTVNEPLQQFEVRQTVSDENEQVLNENQSEVKEQEQPENTVQNEIKNEDDF